MANPLLLGHEAEEAQFCQNFSSGHTPHAWLIAGIKGIGKATFAYRLARGIFAHLMHAEPAAAGLFGDEPSIPPSLIMDPSHPVFSRIVNHSHSDLLVLSPKEASSEITIDDVRVIGNFLKLTPAESDWRIVIVDSADALNRNAANALLKILEEPPARALIFLLAHKPGNLLPTIRSRCHLLKMRPLSEPVLNNLMKQHFGALNEEEAAFAVSVAEGSAGLAITIYKHEGKELYRRMASFLDSRDVPAAHKLADSLSLKGREEQWNLGLYLLQYFLSRMLKKASNVTLSSELFNGEMQLIDTLLARASVDYWDKLWQRCNKRIAEVDGVNMDRKSALLTLLQ